MESSEAANRVGEYATVEAPIVDYTVLGRTAIITMNRAHARNAINAAMASGIEESLDRAEQDDGVWAMIITGKGDVFCAGADLKAVASGDGASVATERGGFAGVVRRDRKKPLIAAVNGHALAGGCEIVLACDMVVAATTSNFGIPEVKRSLLASSGGLHRLPHTIPPTVAMEMALTGDPISAERAAQFGMVNVLCAPGDVVDQAMVLADRVTANAPLAVQASRQIIVDAFFKEDQEASEIARRAFEQLTHTSDFQEGPRAFIEKREPQWTGR